jgi:hypothetical protein
MTCENEKLYLLNVYLMTLDKIIFSNITLRGQLHYYNTVLFKLFRISKKAKLLFL